MQNYLYFLILMLSMNYTMSLNQVKNCENCKWFIKNTNDNSMGLCKLFTTNHNINNVNKITYNFAKHCRDNDFLCGKNGWLFDDININSEIKYLNLLTDNQIHTIESNTKDIFGNSNEFFNSLSKKESDQINKDYETFKTIKDQKDKKNQNDEKESYNNYMTNIAKLNVKKIYKKEKDIYKLFKKK
jgi:hypothetical protein